MARDNELIGKYQLKNRMKKYLPKGSILDGEAVGIMQSTLQEIFDEIMKEVGNQPYKQFSAYLIGKECQRFIVQGTSQQYTIRLMKEIQERLNEWFERLEHGKKPKDGQTTSE